MIVLMQMERFMCAVKSPLFVLFVIMVGVGFEEVFAAQIPAMFVFGDSLVDPGNNNNLKTLAKANYPPNGIDFPNGFTGRYCNGATIVDQLGFLLGLPLIPAVNDPSTQGSNILQGVNFASSSSSGILNDTGKFGQRMSMNDQVEIFGNKTLPDLSSQVLSINGKEVTIKDYLAKSLFLSNSGNDDFLNNYLSVISNPLQKPIPPNFNDMILNQYTTHLKNLYNYGARKFLVMAVAPLGCIPINVAFYSKDPNQCYEPFNEIVVKFNAKAKSMIDQLNKELPESYFLFWDLYVPCKQIIDNPSRYGFKYSYTACCGAGPNNALSLCIPGVFLCHDRSEYVFWDIAHTTEAANKIFAKIAYEGTVQSVYPMNVKQLIHL